MDGMRIYACWLDTVYWLTSEAKYRLLAAAGSTMDIWNMTQGQLTELIGLKGCERFMQQKKRYGPQQVWDYITGCGIRYTFCQASDFPQKLAQIPDPPFGIFYKGELPQEDVPAVAVIGARKCSEYGRSMAESFAAALAGHGVSVISGMALGVDGISQKAALKAGGKSYGVLGCGVDVVYPRTNEELYKQLGEKGGVLSEYPPGLKPRPELFPPRNRIISALSDAVLVVEAREKSGTLITVDMALEQGREVYAVPGRCTDSLSRGCNRLLRQGAGIAITPEEFIRDMNWDTLPEKKAQKDDKKTKGLSAVAKELYGLLDALPVSQDTIMLRLREKKNSYTVPQVCSGLVELELNGFAVRRNGQYQLVPEAVFDN